MKKPLVSVIIVNWNGAGILGDCLRTLFVQAYKFIEVIVIDNNSSDNSVAVIKRFKKAKLVSSDTNLGFAGGNNLALPYVKGKYVLLLNTDTLISKDLIETLVDILEKDSSLGVVQPKVLYINKLINSLGGYLTNSGFLYYPGYEKKDKKQYNKESFIFTAYGACVLIRKKLIDSIGLFDPDYFMYFEETDFCMRVWLSGAKILYTPKVMLYHKGAVSSKKFGMEKIYFHSYKNRICTYLKNFQTASLLTIVPLHLLLCEGISLLYLLTGKLSYFLAVQKAILWNVGHLGDTLAKRKIVQTKYRTVSDAEYFKETKRAPRLSYYLYLFKGLRYYKD